MKYRCLLFILGALAFTNFSNGQPSFKKTFTRQDTLRGSINPERIWWNVMKYTLDVTPDYTTKTIKGSKIKRNASKDEPAYEIKQESGAKVLKSESELKKGKK